MSKNGEKNGFWERAAGFIVDRRTLFFCLFAALVVFSMFSRSWVNVENDITAYLSEDTETRRGLSLMNEQFVTLGTAQLMVEDITEQEALELSERLEAVEGVSSAGFTADSEDCYKGKNALYSLSFDYEGTDEKCEKALNGALAEIGDHEYKLDTDIGLNLSAMIAREMEPIVIIVALVVIAVLLLTSGTYAEVAVLLITFLTAAVINMGTNFVFGTISFVSNSVTIVLQLALSVDYAIILCNRYKQEHETKPVREAAIAALAKAIPEISASSLTTIAGLTAMTFMQFRLGLDMGLVLIKAIVCSLLTVFLLMPGLLVLFGGLMDKTRHKSFVPAVPLMGKFAYATRYIIPPVFVVIVVAAAVVFQSCNFVYGESTLHTVKQNERQIEERAIVESFGEDNLMCVIVPAGDYESEQALLKELSDCPEVKSCVGLASVEAAGGFRLGDSVNARQFASLAGLNSTTSQALFAYFGAAHSEYDSVTGSLSDYSVPLVDLFLFMHDGAEKGSFSLTQAQTDMINGLYDQLSQARVQLQSDKYSRMLVYLALPPEGQETFDFIDEMHNIVGRYYDIDECFVIGDSGSRAELALPFTRDNTIVSVLSIAFVLLILLFTFRSVAMPVLLILVIQGSIWLNFAIPTVTGVNVFFLCYLIVSAIQMGANIDYAIVISSRYLEMRKALQPKQAIIETMNLSFPTIITSGSMMSVAGLLIGNLSSEPVIAGIGKYVGIGTIISVVLVSFVLPQILLFGDRLISFTTIKLKARLKNPRKTLRTAGAVMLAAAMVFALAALPIGLSRMASEKAEDETREAELSAQIEQIEQGIARLDAGQQVFDESAMDFAEGVMTEKIGSVQLTDGQQQYDAGAAQLSEGQALYDEKYAEFASAEQQYNEGLATLNAGAAQYNEGAAQLEEAKKQYAQGEAKLAEAEPIYNRVLPLYNNYQKLLDAYEAADGIGQAILWPQVTAAKALFTTELSGSGYSIESLVSEYNAGKAQLAEAEVQIAQGQAKLDAAAEEIAEGQARLDEAAAQLADGKKQLSDAKAQLDEGYAALDVAAGQLSDGRDTLAANESKLSASLEALKNYDDDRQYVDAAVAALMENEDISSKAGAAATYEQVLDCAKRYLSESSENSARQLREQRLTFTLGYGALAVVLAAAIYLHLKRMKRAKRFSAS